MMAKKSLQKSLQLGRAVEWPDSPEKAQLDRVPNPQADTNYLVRFTAPEFTSICPVTGQPDFAHLMIDYVPGQWLLESKSLKLYVASFRNHGAFHEDCTASGLQPRSSRNGCASAATGIRAAASRSTCSGRPANSPTACGYPTRASRPIAAGDDRTIQPVPHDASYRVVSSLRHILPATLIAAA
jgi:7-cyano-7-deazaguanine reductase